MKNFLKNNWFNLIISFCIISICLSLGYYLVVRTIEKDKPLKECLKETEQMKELMEKDGINSILIFDTLSKAKENCYKQY